MKTTTVRAMTGLLLLLLCFSFTGCYTVIRRSGATMDEQDQYLSGEQVSEHRIDPDHIWYDPFYYWYYPSAYGHWRYYYTYPWWWNDYWFWDPGPDRPSAPVDTERHIWDDRRGTDWSSPPSSPAPPSTASQPKRSSKESESSRSSESSPQSGQRRSPDWNKNDTDRSTSDLQQQERRGEEDDGPDGSR
jgi:hypothetical protein